MKLTKLKLSNLGSYADAEIAFADRVTLVGGPNGGGKTTIRRAIELALTGGCDLSESGQGLDGLRRDGSRRKWSIEIEGATSAGETFLFPRGEGEGPRAQIQDLVAKYLDGIAPHHVRACLRATDLIYGTEKAAQRIVLELCDPGVPVPAALKAAAARQSIVLEATASIAQLDAAEKIARAARLETGRLVDSLKAAAPEVPPEVPESATAMSLAELDEQVTRGTARLAELRTERDRTLRALTKKESEPEKLARALEDARRALAEIAPETEDAEALAAQLRTLEDERSAAIEARRVASERVKKEEEFLALAEARRKLAQNEADRLAQITDCCPTCTRRLTKAEASRLLDPLRKKWAEANAHAAGAAQTLQEAQSALNALPDPAVLDRQFREACGRIDAFRGREDRRHELAGNIAALEAQLAEAQSTSEAELAALRATAEECGQKIATCEQRVQALSRYAGARHAAEKTAAARRDAEAKHEELEWLVGQLGKGGIRTEGDGAGLDDLQNVVNGVTIPLGFEVDLGPVARLEGPLLVNGRPAKLLSSSEQVRVGVGIQAAIARFSGLGLVVIDDVDRCLGTARKQLNEALRSIGSDLQVIVLMAVKNPAEFVASAPAMAAAYGWSIWSAMPGEKGSTLECVGAVESEAA